jgi:hypothetical protein
VHAQSLSTRCRDLYNQLKTYKRELKRAHKTVKTFELMAAAVGGAAATAQAATAAATATPTKQDAAPQQPQQPQQQQASQQQGSVMTAGVSRGRLLVMCCKHPSLPQRCSRVLHTNHSNCNAAVVCCL